MPEIRVKRAGSRESIGKVDLQAMELDFVNKHDRHEGGEWYFIEAQWLKKWKAYVTKKGPAPGPISNTKLLDARQGFRVPLPGQKLKEHYRGVGMEVWQFLQSRHGGGPAIQSDGALDLYKATVHPVEGSVNPSSPRALGSPKAMKEETSASTKSTTTGGTEAKIAPAAKPLHKRALKTLLGAFRKRRPSDEQVWQQEKPKPRFSQLSDS
mmetsp:Transcript_53799/g.125770  ORF Transcript_53799/g.125770 Transcript_53799/m.125770 type:complete len:210 (+) Transcript_53799:60-689(+)